jgi:hypothetical protein
MPHDLRDRISSWKDRGLGLLTAERIRAFGVVWIIFAVPVYFIDLMHQTAVGLSDGKGRPFGDDFINYWSAAKLAFMGRSADVYNWESFHEFEADVTHGLIGSFHYSYPPILLFLTFPLVFLPFVPALFAWLAATWAAFYGALRLARPKAHGLLLSLAIPAVLWNAVNGQNGMLLAALMGGGLTLLPTRPIVAGVLFGIMSFKPQLGILIPVALIAGKYWRTFIAASLTVLALIALSLAFYGANVWGLYFQNANVLREVILERSGAAQWYRFVSVFITARQMGLGIVPAYVVQGVVGIFAAGIVIRLWRLPVSHDIRCAALVLCTLLATPYAHDYDFVVMAFVVVWLDRAYRDAKFANMLLLLLPILSTAIGYRTGWYLGPFMLLPAIGLILRMRKTGVVYRRAMP